MTNRKQRNEFLENSGAEGDEDGIHEFESYVRDTVDLTLIDEVFHSWCRYWSPEYDPDPEKKLPYPYRFEERFVHSDIPYLSTIFDIGQEGKTWRNIILCNDGFVYHTVPGNPKTIARHDFDGWNLLNVCRPHLQNVERYLERHCGSNRRVCVFYNCEQQRLDIKCRGRVNIMLKFERRRPFEELDNMFE
jgi:hypothetical protein